MRAVRRLLGALFCSAMTVSALATEALKPFELEFGIFRDDDRIGQASMRLSQDDKGWHLITDSQAKILIFNVGDKEVSDFLFQDQQLQSLRYERTRSLPGRSEQTLQTFQWPEGKETGKRKKREWTLEVPKDVMDRHVQLVRLMTDVRAGKKEMHYTVSDSGRLREYHYRVDGEETLTVMGQAEKALRLLRVRDASEDRKTLVWLSPRLGFLPVKVSQSEDDWAAEMRLEKIGTR